MSKKLLYFSTYIIYMLLQNIRRFDFEIIRCVPFFTRIKFFDMWDGVRFTLWGVAWQIFCPSGLETCQQGEVNSPTALKHLQISHVSSQIVNTLFLWSQTQLSTFLQFSSVDSNKFLVGIFRSHSNIIQVSPTLAIDGVNNVIRLFSVK